MLPKYAPTGEPDRSIPVMNDPEIDTQARNAKSQESPKNHSACRVIARERRLGKERQEGLRTGVALIDAIVVKSGKKKRNEKGRE